MEKKDVIEFIGIGAIKSGTTWLSDCLEAHPDVLFSSQKSRKEINFFNSTNWRKAVKEDYSNYHKGLDWYLNQFPKAEKGKIRGECSVSYLPDPLACYRIYHYFPKIKIIACLRNPAKMIYSLHHWSKYTVQAHVPDSFSHAIAEGYYLDLAQYYKQLEKFFKLFPRQNIKVVLLKEIKNNPEKVVADVYSFLGVDSNFVPANLHKKSNTAVKSRYPALNKFAGKIFYFFAKLGLEKVKDAVMSSHIPYKIYRKLNTTKLEYDPIPQAEKHFLQDYFKEDIIKLEKFLDRDLSSWYSS